MSQLVWCFLLKTITISTLSSAAVGLAFAGFQEGAGFLIGLMFVHFFLGRSCADYPEGGKK